jgi:hypothetical protein
MFEIHAIDLLTIDTTVVIRGIEDPLHTNGMGVDTVDMKLYFRDGNNISRANFDGTGLKVVLKNVGVFCFAIDWIGRRIFWVEGHAKNRIFVADLNGKGKRTLTTTLGQPICFAVDPTVG